MQAPLQRYSRLTDFIGGGPATDQLEEGHDEEDGRSSEILDGDFHFSESIFV
jgi:hypothetical protein